MHAVTLPASQPPASLDPDAAAGGRLVAADGRALPLKSAHLAVEARGGVARAVLTQRFRNPTAAPLSVRYLLPLPARSAVAGFAFTLGDTRVVGEVQPRLAARQMFEEAIVEGRTAALVEEARSTLFTQRVGNIPPEAEVVCEIVLDQQLAWLDEGAWAWRFPTVVGPRYTGGPGVTPDAGRISVPVATADLPARAGLELRIGDALTGAVESPSHPVLAEAEDEETAVRLAQSAALDRDIVVRWPVATPAVGVAVSAARPADPGHQGRTYGLLTLVPPRGSMTPRARDLTLLVDTSGSMGGQPLDQAKRVMKALVERLGDRDRIEMISFGSRPVRFRSEPIAATRDGKRAALKWLRKLSASGGTEMHTAVVEALRPLRSDAQRQIVLVTDGYIGFEQQILHRLLTDLPPDCRLHTVGVGSAPNRTLTEGAARAGRGTELIVGLGEDADAAAARLVARTADPLVTELSVTGPGLAELAPVQLPDLYAGAPALVGVACAAAGPLTIRGRTADGPYEHTVEVPKLALGEGAQGVCALFGRNRVDDLEMRLTAGEPTAVIDAGIERAGVLFAIATRKTSWVAITDAVTVEPGGHPEVEQPHMLPHGASVEGFGLRAAALAGFGGAAAQATAAPRGALDGRVGGMASKIRRRVLAPPAPGVSKGEAPAGPELEAPAEDGWAGDLDDDAFEREAPLGLADAAGGALSETPAPLDEASRLFDTPVADKAAKPAPSDPSLVEPSALSGLEREAEPSPASPIAPLSAPPAARVRWIVWLVVAIIAALIGLWLAFGGAAVEAPADGPAETPAAEEPPAP